MEAKENKGTEYEIFIKEIYDILHNATGIDNRIIQHNVVMQGKSGASHQIDLYWEFEQAGILYRVAVECKNYKNAVKKNNIAAFYGVLNDLPGNVQGVYVTSSEYQKGALEFAASYGITLMVIRMPNDEDWKGRIKDIYIDICAITPKILRVKFEINQKEAEAQGITSTTAISAWTDQAIIEDRAGQRTYTLLDLLNDLPVDETEVDKTEENNCVKEYSYEDAYAVIEGKKIKLDGIRIEYEVQKSHMESEILGEQIVKAIVKNAQTGVIKTVHYDGLVNRHER